MSPSGRGTRRRTGSFCDRAGRVGWLRHHRRTAMNWDTIAGNWKQFQGKARQQWGKLTDDDLELVKGKRDVVLDPRSLARVQSSI